MNNSLPSRRLLLVGRDLGLAAALSVILGGVFRTDIALTTSDALRYVVKEMPDLVLCHLAGDDVDMLCFLQRLRSRAPESRILVLTDLEDRRTLTDFSRLSVDGIVQHPATIAELLDRLIALAGLTRSTMIMACLRHRQVWRTIEYLSRRYAEPLTIAYIAAHVGVSPSHLIHLFRTATGMTVKGCLTRIRITIAKHCLAHSEEKLEVLAEQLGFCDASHLSRVFRQCTGLYPGEYRQSRWRAREAPQRNESAVGAQVYRTAAPATHHLGDVQ